MSGDGYQAAFAAGEAVVGFEIEINGLRSRECYVPSASAGGTVLSGVINPFPGELYPECTTWVADPETVNGLIRRLSGEGATATFAAGEAVAGFEIEIGGLRARECYVPSASAGGTVLSGVVNPKPGELLPECTTWVADPETVNGLERREGGEFTAGETVSGYFYMDGWFYTNCFVRSAPLSGSVTDGVVNPHEDELAPIECDLETVNGMPRREGGSFKAGEAVTGFTVMNGVESPTNCYMQGAPHDGNINPKAGGVVNPWKSEIASPC